MTQMVIQWQLSQAQAEEHANIGSVTHSDKKQGNEQCSPNIGQYASVKRSWG